MIDPAPRIPKCVLIDGTVTPLPAIGHRPTVIGSHPTFHVARIHEWDAHNPLTDEFRGPFTTRKVAESVRDAWSRELGFDAE
jgi:hypothetical protein